VRRAEWTDEHGTIEFSTGQSTLDAIDGALTITLDLEVRGAADVTCVTLDPLVIDELDGTRDALNGAGWFLDAGVGFRYLSR
jgi:hypothetical protein